MTLPILNKQTNKQTKQSFQQQAPLMREGTCGGQHKFNSLPNIEQDETYHLLMAVTLVPCPLPRDKSVGMPLSSYFQCGAQTDLARGTELRRALPAAIPVAGGWKGLLWPRHLLTHSHRC